MPIDDIDAAILRILSVDADVSNTALARRLEIAESTCAHRVRALRARGVIRDTRARIDPVAMGFPLQAMIRVRLTNHTPANVRSLADALAETPRVLQVFHVAGADDFLVHVAVQDTAALRDIVLEHITVHPVVRATETQLIFDLRDGRGLL
ncbi:Lrp/AsnC family transcriptional regulator [Microbacterium flavum]|uniref:Lrp/AsnC family transcriptional regulator n=1 Tax=Microbacterium flavum TaxID=415216 RepID=A0ABS5XQ45_9MICO|nr:Lrp/AsnC family transcriptional regulator [Microbacterium flavum]MBT8796650.1 Lrp/AsnC family transcriptional regulator [Microbacterium flavum]